MASSKSTQLPSERKRTIIYSNTSNQLYSGDIPIAIHELLKSQLNTNTVQLASKFTARIFKNAYLARFFARHVGLLAFAARVSRSLVQETMLASYTARDLYVLTRSPTRDKFSVHKNLLVSHFTQ